MEESRWNHTLQINCRTLTEKIRALREPDNLCFALLAGTAVSDFADHTDENIRAVDAQTHFDGVIHLGDILNGSIPENASRFVLSQELARFQNATASGKLYIACGDDDGYRNERYVGQIVTGIVTDERWYQETAYLESVPRICIDRRISRTIMWISPSGRRV